MTPAEVANVKTTFATMPAFTSNFCGFGAVRVASTSWKALSSGPRRSRRQPLSRKISYPLVGSVS
jgi:hypothetical protein